MRSIRKIVVLGANGAMGSAAGAVFAAAGMPTVFLARTLEKAEAGRARAEQLTRGRIPSHAISCGTYASDLGHALAEADLVFEAIVEDTATKCELFALIDRLRRADTIVATGTSGVALPRGTDDSPRAPIGSLCETASAGFRRN